MFVFILRKDCVLENILELVDKQMQEVLTIGVILLAKTILFLQLWLVHHVKNI